MSEIRMFEKSTGRKLYRFVQNQRFNLMKKFDLDDRTLQFAISVRKFIKAVKFTLINQDDCRQ